jgi:stage V sporulation protein B
MSDANAARAPQAVGAGRGLLFISGAKLWFMVAGYAIQFTLPRALSPEQYGVWGVVLACVSLFNNVMVTGSVQTISRFVSQVPERVGTVVRAGLWRNFIGGGVVAALFVLGAPLIAKYVISDMGYTSYLRVAGIVTGCYALYAVFVGAANGLHHFHKQAGLDVCFATLRAGLVIAAAVITHSVMASVGGFAAASAAILVIASLWVGVGPAGGKPMARGELERYFGWVAAYLVVVNLLMFIDGLLVKKMMTLAFDAERGNLEAGYYASVQTIARLPYQLILAVTFVIFPMMSRATFDADAERAKRYVLVTMRYSLIVVGLMAAPLAARPDAVMRLLFPPVFAVAAPALPILLLGYVAFSLFNILGTILNSAGETRASLQTGLWTVAVCAAAVWAALHFAIGSGSVLPSVAAACATTFAMLVGVVLAGVAVHRRFGAALPLATTIRVVVAMAVAAFLGHFWPTHGMLGGKIGTLISLIATGIVYLVVVSPDLHPRQLRALRASTRA